jgi:hypothetical protein
MLFPSIESLRKSRQQMKAASDELIQLRQELLSSPTPTQLDRTELVIEQLKKLKAEFDTHFIITDDKRMLFRPQHKALELFAANNKLDLSTVISKVSIERGLAVRGHFTRLGLRTLHGLEDISSLRILNIDWNKNLSSLSGVPHESLATVQAHNCGLRGDLSALAQCLNLQYLWVWDNPLLTSLRGIPTKSIIKVSAIRCRLTGDHSFLAEAKDLELLALLQNPPSLSIDRSRFHPHCTLNI